MSIDTLIARLEAAEEGSRELDGPIWREVVKPELNWEDRATRGEWWPCEVTFGRIYSVPHYTTSLDSALTLVPNDELLHAEARRCGLTIPARPR